MWIAIPVGAMATMGWMVGMTWLTLPTSEEPRRSGIGLALDEPGPAHVRGEEIQEDVWFRFSGS